MYFGNTTCSTYAIYSAARCLSGGYQGLMKVIFGCGFCSFHFFSLPACCMCGGLVISNTVASGISIVFMLEDGEILF